MKKILFFTFYFLLIQIVFATNYYVDANNGNDSNNGISETTPWKTLGKISNYSFQPGDFILLKKGGVWYEPFRISSSGNLNSPITISTYGNGNKPIVNVIRSFNNFSWTNLGNNIWSTNLSFHPRRLLKDNVEILDAANGFEQELGTNIPTLVEWSHNNGVLKLYSTDSPTNHNIQFSSNPNPLYMSNKHYININGIKFIGGYTAGTYLYRCSNIQLTNIDTGTYANLGLYINGGNTTRSQNIIIDNCIVDSRYTFNYTQAGTTQGITNRGPREGIILRSIENCEIKNNFVKNYCHANLNLFASATERGGPPANSELVVINNKIHHNTFTAPDIAYGGRIAIDGYCSNNEFYNNLIIDTSVRSQFNGFNNHIHHNIFLRTRNSPLKGYATGQSFGIQGYYISTHDNIYENNIMVNCQASGIIISGNNQYGNITNNIFRNNIIYNCGLNQNNIAIKIDADSPSYNYTNDGNTFESNLVFNQNTTNTISYYGNIINVPSFNSQNQNHQTILNTLANNPMFIDAENNDFHLQTNSPCINTGTNTLSTFDYEGNSIPNNNSDIGIYEYQDSNSNCTGISVSNVTVSNISSNGATVTWEGNPNAKVWLYIHELDSTSSQLTATGNSYTYSTLGENYTFTVFVQGENNCDEPLTAEFSTSSTLHLDSYNLNHITIYPNPAKNTLTIKQNQNKLKNYTIINTIGQKVATGILNNTTIDIQNLKKGIYFIKLSNDNNSITIKFIKQ